MSSYFSKDHFPICAFGNFDHADRSFLSGTRSDHDTAVVMFQVKPDIIPSKPNVTAMNLPNSTEHSRNEPPKSSANLPPNFSVDEDLYQNEELQKDHHDKEFILSLIKTGLIEEQESIPSPLWAGCRALISSANVPVMYTGFLPYLPHPVTEKVIGRRIFKQCNTYCQSSENVIASVICDMLLSMQRKRESYRKIIHKSMRSSCKDILL